MPNNKKQKKIRNYNRYSFYYEQMKPKTAVFTVDSLLEIFSQLDKISANTRSN